MRNRVSQDEHRPFRDSGGYSGSYQSIVIHAAREAAEDVHSQELNPYIQLEGSPFYIVKETKEWDRLLDENNRVIPRIAGMSSFGFGGSNAHIIIEEWEDKLPAVSKEVQTPQLIVLSAKNEDRLKVYVGELINYLEVKSNNDETRVEEKDIVKSIPEDRTTLSEITYTLQTGREPMEERLAVVVESKEELLAKLGQYIKGTTNIENLYLSHTRAGRGKGNLLIDGKEGEEYLRALIKSRKLSKLGQLWVSG